MHKILLFLSLLASSLTFGWGLFPAHAGALELHRGVAVHEWLNWSPITDQGEYEWPPYRSESEWLGRYRSIDDWPDGDVSRRSARWVSTSSG